jgi:hypothetical protein
VKGVGDAVRIIRVLTQGHKVDPIGVLVVDLSSHPNEGAVGERGEKLGGFPNHRSLTFLSIGLHLSLEEGDRMMQADESLGVGDDLRECIDS